MRFSAGSIGLFLFLSCITIEDTGKSLSMGSEENAEKWGVSIQTGQASRSKCASSGVAWSYWKEFSLSLKVRGLKYDLLSAVGDGAFGIW